MVLRLHHEIPGMWIGVENGFGNSGKQWIEDEASGSIAPGFVVSSACPPSEARPALYVNAALSRAKDGEDQAREAEPIFGDVIKSL